MVRLRVVAFALVLVLPGPAATAGAGLRPGPAPDGRLLQQGELLRFFVLPETHSYRAPEAWAQSADASVARPSPERLRREGFAGAWSRRLRAWHGVNDIYPFKPGWRGVSAAIEFASPAGASTELAAMVRDAEHAYPSGAIEHFRPFRVHGLPGGRGYFVGRDSRIAFTAGRFVYVLSISWGQGAHTLTVGPPLSERLERAAGTLFRRVRTLSAAR